MKVDVPNITEQMFLSGGGETGQLIRLKDWSPTVLGAPANWPQSLITILNLVLNSRFPMYLCWGPELLVFYNDAYAPNFVQTGKHPLAIGRKAEECWKENWKRVKPFIEKALAGTSTWQEDILIPVYRNKNLEESYWTNSFSPVTDDSGAVKGVLVVCTETTEKINALNKAEHSNKRFYDLAMQAPVGIIILREPDFKIEMANEACQVFMQQDLNSIINVPVFDVLPDIKPLMEPVLQHVMQTGESFVRNEFELSLKRNGIEDFYFNFVVQPLREIDERISGVMILLTDVTEIVTAKTILEKSEKELRENEVRLRLATEGTQLSTWDLNLETRDIVHSPRLAEIFGHKPDKMLTHRQMREQIHPSDQNYVEKTFERALKTGVYSYEARVVHPDGNIRWIKTQGKVIFDEAQNPLRMLGTLMDITERWQAEEKVAKMAAIVKFSDDAIISKTLDGVITSWNDGAQRIFGYTSGEMVGQTIYKLIPPHLMEEEVKILSLLKKGLRVDHFETQRLAKDGRLIDISLSISPVKDLHGTIVGASKIARDVTKQKQAERQTKENEQRFKLLADSMPQLIWTADKDGILNYFNQSVYNYTGLSKEQMENDGWIRNIHPADREENSRRWAHAIQTGEDFLFEMRFERYDGEYQWHLSRAVPQKDADGNIQMWVGTSTDIQDQKAFSQQLEIKVEERTRELNTEKHFAQTILDSSVDNICVFDKDMRYLVVNKRSEEVYKRSKSALIGKKLEEVFPQMKDSDFYLGIKKAFKGKSEHILNYTSLVTGKHYELFLIPLKTGNEVSAVLAIAHDNTEIVEASERINKTNEQLVKTNTELAQFAYVASHDLQEPLRKIQTFAARILEIDSDTLSETGKDYFNRIHGASKRMQQLILDLISYSRANTAEKYFEMTDLNVLLQNAREHLKETIDQKHAIVLSSNLPVINVIPFQFEQLFTNIISNALKFSKNGVIPQIYIDSRIVDGKKIQDPEANSGMAYYHISVKDNGIGFEPQFGKRIFQVFQRLHSKEDYSGTGIGLAIVKKIVENHNGIITTSSELGKGATFNIYIPV